jgi:hypothetical protein
MVCSAGGAEEEEENGLEDDSWCVGEEDDGDDLICFGGKIFRLPIGMGWSYKSSTSLLDSRCRTGDTSAAESFRDGRLGTMGGDEARGMGDCVGEGVEEVLWADLGRMQENEEEPWESAGVWGKPRSRDDVCRGRDPGDCEGEADGDAASVGGADDGEMDAGVGWSPTPSVMSGGGDERVLLPPEGDSWELNDDELLM